MYRCDNVADFVLRAARQRWKPIAHMGHRETTRILATHREGSCMFFAGWLSRIMRTCAPPQTHFWPPPYTPNIIVMETKMNYSNNDKCSEQNIGWCLTTLYNYPQGSWPMTWIVFKDVSMCFQGNISTYKGFLIDILGDYFVFKQVFIVQGLSSAFFFMIRIYIFFFLKDFSI